MDPLEYTAVRFHFGGKFISDGRTLHYVGGKEELSYIERDKLGLVEVNRQLKEHHNLVEGQLLHCLIPGLELRDGLFALLEDQSCMKILEYFNDGGVVNIYVEDPAETIPISDFADGFSAMCGDDKGGQPFPEPDLEELDDDVEVIGSSKEIEREKDSVRKFYGESSSSWHKEMKKKKAVHKPLPKLNFEANSEANSSSDDSDFVPVDCSSSDEEVAAINHHYKEFKAQLKAGKDAPFDGDLLLGDINEKIEAVNSDEDESYDEDSDGEVVIRGATYPTFDRKAKVPHFTLGLKFSEKKEFKEAIIKYGLEERKEIKFVKDEGDRVRAKCNWPMCPWVCLLKKTTRFMCGHLCNDQKLIYVC